MDDPKCETCGHTKSHHNAATSEDQLCRMQKATFDKESGGMKPLDRCACPGYRGPDPQSASGACPHEFMDGSRVCVACKKPVAKRVDKK